MSVALAQPAPMPANPQSSCTALNQLPRAHTRRSWPRRGRRGNTAPVAPSDPTQAPFASPTSAEPSQLLGRVATEPILRDAESDLRPVNIGAYRLSWDRLRPYLETQFGYQLSSSHTPAMISDIFTVWLPRELNTKELADIDNLRLRDAKQQKRIDDRLDVTPSRPLDSDEEVEGEQ